MKFRQFAFPFVLYSVVLVLVMGGSSYSQTSPVFKSEQEKFMGALERQANKPKEEINKKETGSDVKATKELMHYYTSYLAVKSCYSEDKENISIVKGHIRKLEDEIKEFYKDVDSDAAWTEASSLSSFQAMVSLLPEDFRDKALDTYRGKSLDDQKRLLCTIHSQNLLSGFIKYGIVEDPSQRPIKKDF